MGSAATARPMHRRVVAGTGRGRGGRRGRRRRTPRDGRAPPVSATCSRRSVCGTSPSSTVRLPTRAPCSRCHRDSRQHSPVSSTCRCASRSPVSRCTRTPRGFRRERSCPARCRSGTIRRRSRSPRTSRRPDRCPVPPNRRDPVRSSSPMRTIRVGTRSNRVGAFPKSRPSVGPTGSRSRAAGRCTCVSSVARNVPSRWRSRLWHGLPSARSCSPGRCSGGAAAARPIP